MNDFFKDILKDLGTIFIIVVFIMLLFVIGLCAGNRMAFDNIKSFCPTCGYYYSANEQYCVYDGCELQEVIKHNE